MAKELVMTLEDDLKYEVLEAAAFYEHRIGFFGLVAKSQNVSS